MNKMRYTIPLIEEYETIFNVRSFGAKGDGVTDDTAAIQAAIDAARSAGGGVVYLPAGTYVISSRINLAQKITVLGAGKHVTTIKQTAMQDGLYAANTLYATYNICIKDISITGPGPSTENICGIHLVGDGGVNVGWARLERVYVAKFYDGVRIERPILTCLEQVESRLNSRDGIQILGGGTSTVLKNCWAWQNSRHGYYYTNIHYSAFIGCASDGNGGKGYYFDGETLGIIHLSIVACGAENNAQEAFLFARVYGLNVEAIGTYLPSPSTHNYDIIKVAGVRNARFSSIVCAATPASGYYTLNITQNLPGGAVFYPLNLTFYNCEFGNVGGSAWSYGNFLNCSTGTSPIVGMKGLQIGPDSSDTLNKSYSITWATNAPRTFNAKLVNVGGAWQLQFLDNADTVRFIVYENGNIETTTAGAGIIVKTPDGTKRYRIGVDNTGAVVATLL